MSEVRIGTSGWNYPNGKGTWNGIFYPPSRRRPRGFDELTFYAEHFNTVEVNATFYGQPRADVSRRWASRTPRGFTFSVKLYQKFTHPRMFEERTRRSIGGSLGPADDTVDELSRLLASDVDEFRRGIDPLAEHDKLGAVLVQFPPSFRKGPAGTSYLGELLHLFRAYPLAVELRHRSWSDAVGDTLGLLNTFGAAWVQIDEPKFRFSIRQNFLPNVRGFYYMRLHGRNAAQWWKHDTAEDRYDYLYTAAELREFAETAAAARQIVRKLYLYTNNHFSAKSVANAAMLKQQLGEPLTGPYTDEFLTRYPEVRAILQDATHARTSV